MGRWRLQLRLLLHAAATVLLTWRSSQLGAALHPFQRALANEWVRLLFYVEALEAVAGETVAVTLPHFLLEAEEEVAANVDDEFFSGGFAARASALPVGALFTIDETRQHLHGAVANYFRLADVGLDAFLVSGNASLPPPLLTVRADVGDQEALDTRYNITNASASDQWPAPLRLGGDAARQQETRVFFDELDAMELKLVVGMKVKYRRETHSAESEKLYLWAVVIRYDLLNQGHLEVTMNYDLVRVPLLNSEREGEEEDMPPVLLDTSVMLNWITLGVICLYQVSQATLWAREMSV
ncbi:unnamed protein product [Phytophthora lilii]|uniref:Unnamed protein product n=1 Tax=Phytophthora lilii TaxID=2077276 RepID=A0A9W6WVD3_9STRA|nr:unnamed protein product [Phytophthora lilii]